MDQEKVIIKMEKLSKKFGSFYAVKDLSLEIRKGEILGFLGPNGSGKSTTMKMLANLLTPNEGEIYIRLNGDFQKLTSRTKDHLLNVMGFLIENPAFFENTTPRKILKYFAKLKGYPRDKIDQRVEEVLQIFELTEWIDKKISTFSKGMRQKLGIMSAIIHDPDVIVLDEPHSGLDPKARREVRKFILKLKELGKTVFLSSHLLFEVSEVADRIAIISHGQLVACDTMDSLEQKAKKSIFNLEVLDSETQSISKLEQIIQPFTGYDEPINIKFNKDMKIFEGKFNARPENQYKIVKALIENGVKVVEFSVPKAELLENLYLELVHKNDEEKKPLLVSFQVNQPPTIQIENYNKGVTI